MIRTEASTQTVRRSVQVRGRRLSYLTVEHPETSETLLLIHGSGMSARYWAEQLRGLAHAVRVLAPDLPGHGESDPVAEASVEAYAGAGADLLAGLGTGPVFVAGHSLGGAVALALAARRPHLVNGLVLLSSCARLAPTNPWAESFFMFLPPPLRKIAFCVMARRILFAPGASDLALRLGMEEVLSCPAETLLSDLKAAKAMDLTEQARGLEVPTLIVCGSRDAVTPRTLSERLHELIPRSRLTIIEGAGHMLLLEAPERVNRDILDFIASVGRPLERPRSRRSEEVPRRSWRRGLRDWTRALFRGRGE